MGVSINTNKTLGVVAGTSIIAAQTSGFTNNYSTDYDGINDYITVGNPANLNFEKADDFSISLWIKRSPNDGTTQCIGGRASHLSPFGGYLLFANGNKLNFRFRGANSKHIGVKTSVDIPNNVWTNYVCTYNGTGAVNPSNNQFRIYKNGVQETTTSIDIGNPSNISAAIPFNIGTRGDSPTFTYEGKIDEFAIWDSKLELADAQAIYGTGTPNDLNSLSTPPLSWWRFEEGTGTTANDLGTGGNNGTLTNGTAYSTDVP